MIQIIACDVSAKWDHEARETEERGEEEEHLINLLEGVVQNGFTMVESNSGTTFLPAAQEVYIHTPQSRHQLHNLWHPIVILVTGTTVSQPRSSSVVYGWKRRTGQAKIRNLEHIIFIQEQIRPLDVAVKHPSVVAML
jgi:hypothetical protein